MVSAISFIAALCIPVVSSSNVRYNAETHVPHASLGCGSASPYAAGKSIRATANHEGFEYTYRVYVPKSYDANTPMPLIMQFHGWGLRAASEERGSGISSYADEKGYIAVFPQGQGDNSHSGGPWYSWNVAGSTQSPGPAGATCTASAGTADYCYNSCAPCGDSPQCDWTTCANDISPSGIGTEAVNGIGTEAVTGFVPSLWDTLEKQLCIDTTREYVAGESNGGMMTYQLGVDLSERWAAIAPQFGSFHRGFTRSPSAGLPVIDIHGSQDQTIPANTSLSADGWYYTPVSQIFDGDSYAPGWKTANRCSGPASHYPTRYDGTEKLYCVSEGDCPGGDVVRCSWNGGHNWFGNSAALNGGLVTDFLLQWTKPTHTGGAGKVLEEVQVHDLLQAQEHEEVPHLRRVLTSAPAGHYGRPFQGCLSDERALSLGGGAVCGPRIGVLLGAGVPEPMCKLGVRHAFGEDLGAHGCPYDAPVSEESRAFPVCVARGETGAPSENGAFTCVLACPCEVEAKDDGTVHCSEVSDAHCQEGAFCKRGELKEMSFGVCTFPQLLVPVVV